MGTELGKFNGKRLRFQATVERFGSKKSYKGWPEKTLLLVRVQLVASGQEVTDHLWFTVRKTLDSLNLEPGVLIRFDARVNTYKKGYHKNGIDYKLTHPTNFAMGEIMQQLVQQPKQLTLF